MSAKSKHLSARAFLFCSSRSPTFFGPLNVDPVPNLTMRFAVNVKGNYDSQLIFLKNKTESENKKIGLNNWKQGTETELKNNDHNVLPTHSPPETAVFYHNMKKPNWNAFATNLDCASTTRKRILLCCNSKYYNTNTILIHSKQSITHKYRRLYVWVHSCFSEPIPC